MLSDDEIAAFIERHDMGTMVAAVDAPLIVPNETGRRPCEALVGQHFARFGAGAYPANRGNPHFRQPRGARLAARLGWDMDPATPPEPGRRVCIEVYPHPAMVSLFELDYVIPYKVKRGREMPALKDAYRRLLDHLETTSGELLRLHESARWKTLRQTSQDAGRKSELNLLEDEVDAIFCAYLAWLWAHRRGLMTVLGDVESGYIVTPPPPAITVGRAQRRQSAHRDRTRKTSRTEETQRLAEAFRAAVPHLTVEESEYLATIAGNA